RLVETGASVSIVDSLYPTCGANYFNVETIRKDVEIVEGDAADPLLIRRLVRGKKYVFNLAGHVSHIESMEDPFSDLHMNALVPLAVLEACRHENRSAHVIYSGTRQSYGRPDSLPLVASMLLKPVTVHGLSKMPVE